MYQVQNSNNQDVLCHLGYDPGYLGRRVVDEAHRMVAAAPCVECWRVAVL